MHEGFISWVLIGGIAGWLAGLLMKGGGFGLLMDIVLGAAGAFVGKLLANKLGIHIAQGWVDSLILATVGAVLILFVTRLIKRE